MRGVQADKRVLVLIPTLNRFPSKTLESLKRQTLPPKTIIVVSGVPLPRPQNADSMDLRMLVDVPDRRLCLGKRVARALNRAIKTVNLDEYDYILKADIDIEFPPDFIERNLSAGYHLLGKGAGLFIDVRAFQRYMGGLFFESCADDEYLQRVFLMNGLKVLPWRWIRNAYILREKGRNCWRRYRIGRDKVRCGDPLVWTILTTLVSVLNTRMAVNIFDLIGYLGAYRQDLRRYPIAEAWAEYLLAQWESRGKVTRCLARLDRIILRKKAAMRKRASS